MPSTRPPTMIGRGGPGILAGMGMGMGMGMGRGRGPGAE
ncbi:hypothetical protein HNP84_004482 [Thermocatellispora tengchongensis]|uniref:Uncharacterized protein n=1 Tax=Thermocatellispora tengchongensis TaxID=1073253 RepID=A0A840P4Z7_9ACTN|nr:hypothetical protein [Thermocatellispora tengchongensis]